MKLQKIVKEIKKVGKQYMDEKDIEIKKFYNNYIGLLIINEAGRVDQYNLCDYWEHIKRGLPISNK